MKKLLLIFVAVISFSACKKENSGFKFDPNATFPLSPEQGVKLKAGDGTLSAKEIVKQATVIHFSRTDGSVGERGFADAQRDTVNCLLKMWSSDVLSILVESSDLKLETGFIEGYDTILIDFKDWVQGHQDTIAYVPNARIRLAEKLIKAAYAKRDYQTCYNVMDTTYKFTPITGAGYRELKKQGKN